MSSYSVSAGSSISGTLTLPSGVSSVSLDWIGVFTVASDYKSYLWKTTVPTGVNTLTFSTSTSWTVPAGGGPYEVRYYRNAGTAPVYVSAVIYNAQGKHLLA